MKFRFLAAIAALCMSISLTAQEANIFNTPRVMVTGEASMNAEADMIYGWLNVFDNSYTFDYSAPYDDKALKRKQAEIVEKAGLKDYLVNVSFDAIKAGTAMAPFQIRCTSKQQFKELQERVAKLTTETFGTSLDFSNAEITDARRKAIKSQLMDQAMADAKMQSEQLAKGAGGRVGKALYIEVLQDYYAMAYDGEYTMEAIPTDMSIRVVVRVQVQFELL